MRSSGSTLDSGWPPVAIERANWRAASQDMLPWFWNILARSPKIGMPWKGLLAPNGSFPASSLTVAS